MELLALYIAILALLVAIPGTVDATWNVILKLRALKKAAREDVNPASNQITAYSKKAALPGTMPAFLKKSLGCLYDNKQTIQGSPELSKIESSRRPTKWLLGLKVLLKKSEVPHADQAFIFASILSVISQSLPLKKLNYRVVENRSPALALSS